MRNTLAIAFDRFMKAIAKVFRIENNHSFNSSLTTKKETGTQQAAFFYIKSDRQFHKILLDEVLYIESLRNHIKIVTINGNFTTLMSISQMEEKLPPQHFLRIHRSFIVALPMIQRFSQTNLSVGNKTLPIGNYYRKEVLERLSSDMI